MHALGLIGTWIKILVLQEHLPKCLVHFFCFSEKDYKINVLFCCKLHLEL